MTNKNLTTCKLTFMYDFWILDTEAYQITKFLNRNPQKLFIAFIIS